MQPEATASLGWPRRLSLACIVLFGLVSIVGSGDDEVDPPTPPRVALGPTGVVTVGSEGATIFNENGNLVEIPAGAHSFNMSVYVTLTPGGISVRRTTPPHYTGPIAGSLVSPNSAPMIVT